MCMFHVLLVIFWVLVSSFPSAMARQARLDVHQFTTELALGPHLDILEDPAQKLELDAVKLLPDTAWTQNTSQVPGFGFTTSRYWLRLRFRNADAMTMQRLLEAQYTHYDFLNIHLVTSKETLSYRLGDHQAFANRPIQYRYFTVPITMEPGSEIDVYISCDSSGTLFFPLRLWDPLVFASTRSTQDYFAGYYYGLLLGMLVYNGFLFITLRRPSYLYYVLYILGFFFFQLSVHGYAFPLLWPNSPWWANNCVPFFLVFSLFWVGLFTRDFIETNRQTPRLHLGLRLIMAACVGIGALSLAGVYSIAIRAGTVLSIFGALIFLLAGITTLYNGFAAARFYVLAFTSFLAGIIVNALMQLGVYEPSFFTEYSIQIGSALEVVLLSMALGHKIRIEQKEAHQAIDKLNKELQHSIIEVRQLNSDLMDNERARTMFFHNSSHELRTPLNGILGYLQLFLMNRYGEINSNSRDAILKIKDLAQSLLQQVNTILELARSRQGRVTAQVQIFQVQELLRSLDVLGQGLQQRYPHSQFQLDSAIEDAGATFCSDFEKILAICRNLLGNAFKFERGDRPNLVSLHLKSSGDGSLHIEITDQGIGIPADQINQVFQEFYQVHGDSRRNYEGTGLGLAIVKQYLDLLQGTIEIESELDRGTRMKVRLLSINQSEAAVRTDGSWTGVSHDVYHLPRNQDDSVKPDSNANKSKAHILVIDDNPTNCEVLREILILQSHQVSICLKGREALDVIRKTPPDLILLDLMMPEMSGEDVLKLIRQDQKLQALPVILITARASEEDRIMGLSLGADDYLAKPIIPDELCLRVHNCLERQRLNEAALEKKLIETSLVHLQRHDEITSHGKGERGRFAIQHHYQSAEIIGGDWYGVHLDEKHDVLYVLLGDVTGHGTSSGLLTLSVAGAVRGWLDSLEQNCGDMDSILVLQRLAETLNTQIFELRSSLSKSMTMCFVAIELQTGKAAYLNAGHHPLYKVHDGKLEPIFRPGTPLGMQESGRFGQLAFQLEPQELLFLYTDGLLENRGTNGHHLSDRNLRLILTGHDNATSLKQRLIDETKTLWKGDELEDDVAFLIISRQPCALEERAV